MRKVISIKKRLFSIALILFTTTIVSADIPALQTSLTTLQSELTTLRTTLNTMKTSEVLNPKLPVKIELMYNDSFKKPWGIIKVTYKDGTEFTYKSNVPAGARAGDCILLPNGSTSWNWKGTKHKWQPGSVYPPYDPNGGIAEADVKDLLTDADIFILSTGVDTDLGEKAETTKFLRDAGKTVWVLPTKLAIDKYNELVDVFMKATDKTRKRVAALIHSTC